MIRFFIRMTLLFLILYSHLSMAQINNKIYKTGYVVTSEDDTLRGKVYVGSNKIRLSHRKYKKLLKFKRTELKAFRHGQHSFENIKGESFKILVKGPVRYYIKDYSYFNLLESGHNIYYCVKRKNEENVTILFVRRRNSRHVYFQSDNLLASLAADLVVEMASNVAEDLDATDQVTMINQMKKKALVYFEDCPPIVKGIEKGTYGSTTSLHKMVERYNRYILKTSD